MNSSNANHFVLNDAANLEFPDWSGMKPHEVRMSPAEAFRWNEEMITHFTPAKKARRNADRCVAEFNL
jgi:hypothetical protein